MLDGTEDCAIIHRKEILFKNGCGHLTDHFIPDSIYSLFTASKILCLDRLYFLLKLILYISSSGSTDYRMTTNHLDNKVQVLNKVAA